MCHAAQVLREGQGQAAGVGAADVLDYVITNALVVDYTGIYKADVGLKGGMITGIGKAGNPDVMEGVTPGAVPRRLHTGPRQVPHRSQAGPLQVPRTSHAGSILRHRRDSHPQSRFTPTIVFCTHNRVLRPQA